MPALSLSPLAGSSPRIAHHHPPSSHQHLGPWGSQLDRRQDQHLRERQHCQGDPAQPPCQPRDMEQLGYTASASPAGWSTGELSSQAHSRWLSVPVVVVIPAWLRPHVRFLGSLLPRMLRDPCANMGSLQPWQRHSPVELQWGSHRALRRCGLSL